MWDVCVCAPSCIELTSLIARSFPVEGISACPLYLQEAKRKELARKQLEETAARQLLEQEQAASVAALALAEQQRLQKQEEAAAAEAAREQEELVAKVGVLHEKDPDVDAHAEWRRVVRLRNLSAQMLFASLEMK